MSGSRSAANLPPPGLAGLDPAWSRLVTAADAGGVRRTWHVLDTHHEAAVADIRSTLLCVHGNPTWSYLFRDLLEHAPADVRVIAVDQLDMGCSERTGTTRRLATRIDDLDRVTDALALAGPVVTVAHDWGGPVSLGWAQRHRPDVAGIVLMNTAVHQPAGASAPTLIRLARSRPVLHPAATATTAFVRAAFELCEQRPPAEVRAGFLAPYRTADRRAAIAEFVRDIPLEPDHPSAATLDGVAAGLADLGDVPALLLWGAADRVFSDIYLHDLERRLPHADVHRYPTAGHFVTEDTDALRAVIDWVAAIDAEGRPAAEHGSGVASAPVAPLTPSALEPSTVLDGLDAAAPGTLAVAEPGGRSVGYGELRALVDRTAEGLVAAGVAAGDRVALMIPPGIDLAANLLACWRAAAVPVLVDAGLGPRGMSAAMASANPDHLIGIPRAMVASRALRWPGSRICTTSPGAAATRLLGLDADLPSLRTRSAPLPPPPAADDIAAIAFTSGATGPSKGVVYDHAALAAQRDAISATYSIRPDDRLVAAFAPFALFGPLLGITSAVPEMDVTEPSTLTATALGDATMRIDASLVFASPAALANVVATADGATPAHRDSWRRVRLVLSAGAPVSARLLRGTAELFPNAAVRTPYGMTECLPVADIALAEIDALPSGDGVCVGAPIDGVDVMIVPLDGEGHATGEPTDRQGVMGEVVVRAAHARLGYDRLWHTAHAANRPPGWHATGDVGSLDADGRLWIGGRIGHVITTVHGPVAPVRLEAAVEGASDGRRSAVVGIGPQGAQQLAAVVERPDLDTPRLAGPGLVDRIRAAVPESIVAVFEVPRLPVDRRHNSKVDRTAVAEWASRALATGTVAAL